MKRNIVRLLQAGSCRVTVFPATASDEEILESKPDGIFLSNGPGDPAALPGPVRTIQKLAATGKPIFGICLGHQLLGLAFGANTFKLKFGHRGANHPVQDLQGGHVVITSQNHGFAVDGAAMPAELEATHRNLNDGTLEGFRHRTLPILAAQFHPEAAPGPHDANVLFNGFLEAMAPVEAVKSLPLQVAVRYLRSRPSRLISSVSLLSIAGIALGVAALVVAMGLLSGYRTEIREKLIGANAQVVVFPMTAGGEADPAALAAPPREGAARARDGARDLPERRRRLGRDARRDRRRPEGDRPRRPSAGSPSSTRTSRTPSA